MATTISVMQAWRQLRNEGVTTVCYHTVRLWVIEVFGYEASEFGLTTSRSPEHPATPSDMERLRDHAYLMAKARGGQVRRNAQMKLALVKVINREKEPISGSWLIDKAMQYGAVSAATLRRRGVTSRSRLSKAEASDLVLRGIAS